MILFTKLNWRNVIFFVTESWVQPHQGAHVRRLLGQRRVETLQRSAAKPFLRRLGKELDSSRRNHRLTLKILTITLLGEGVPPMIQAVINNSKI